MLTNHLFRARSVTPSQTGWPVRGKSSRLSETQTVTAS